MVFWDKHQCLSFKRRAGWQNTILLTMISIVRTVLSLGPQVIHTNGYLQCEILPGAMIWLQKVMLLIGKISTRFEFTTEALILF
jgi:hypothetical protein